MTLFICFYICLYDTIYKLTLPILRNHFMSAYSEKINLSPLRVKFEKTYQIQPQMLFLYIFLCILTQSAFHSTHLNVIF